MSRYPLVCLFLCLLLSVATIANASPPAEAAVIAHYPLLSDGLDATGINTAMTLINAPFQDGGVYCNGIYPGGDPDGCVVETPTLADLNLESFAISAEFKIDQYPLEGDYRPVFMGGGSWRWMGVQLQSDATIALRYNNSHTVTSDQVVTLDTWHKAMITYDGATETGDLYLDDQWVCRAIFTLIHDNDKDVSTSNFASGRTFLGIFRELIVYDGPFNPTPSEDLTWGAVKVLY